MFFILRKFILWFQLNTQFNIIYSRYIISIIYNLKFYILHIDTICVNQELSIVYNIDLPLLKKPLLKTIQKFLFAFQFALSLTMSFLEKIKNFL